MPPQAITSSVKWQDTCPSHLLKPRNDHYIHRNEHVSLPTLAMFGAPGLAHALSGSNLLSNAIKFTPESTITISVEKDRTKNWVVVSVKDTGQGIDASIMPRLFTKFASKSYQGTGLGLFIAKSIVETHMGKIWGENNIDGIGATFSFSLPSI